MFECFIAWKYCFPGGCLSDIITENRAKGEGLPEPELQHLLLQLAQGLRYIHSQNLVHLDIKPGKGICSIVVYPLKVAVTCGQTLGIQWESFVNSEAKNMCIFMQHLLRPPCFPHTCRGLLYCFLGVFSPDHTTGYSQCQPCL